MNGYRKLAAVVQCQRFRSTSDWLQKKPDHSARFLVGRKPLQAACKQVTAATLHQCHQTGLFVALEYRVAFPVAKRGTTFNLFWAALYSDPIRDFAEACFLRSAFATPVITMPAEAP